MLNVNGLPLSKPEISQSDTRKKPEETSKKKKKEKKYAQIDSKYF